LILHPGHGPLGATDLEEVQIAFASILLCQGSWLERKGLPKRNDIRSAVGAGQSAGRKKREERRKSAHLKGYVCHGG